MSHNVPSTKVLLLAIAIAVWQGLTPAIVSAAAGNPSGTMTATYNTVTGVLSVSGDYANAPTGTPKRVGFALFTNGADPVTPGTGSLDGTNTNTMHVLPTSAGASGSWSDTHTLGTAPTSVCVVIYNVNENKIGASSGSNDIPAGSNRNTDNSYEQNGNSFDYKVYSGKLDLNKDGSANNSDDGTLLGKTIINGEVDINASGTVTNADDGTFNGFTVIDGKIDINASGTVTNADDGTFATDPAVCLAPTLVTPNATLTVVKQVVNNNGGTSTAAVFTIHVKTGGVDVAGSPAVGSASGTAYSLVPGTYVVSEVTLPAGYSQTGISGDCAADGSITLTGGQSKTCTITNDDIAPKLHLRKVVVNNSGGTATVGGFTLTANGTGTNDLSGTSPVDSTGILVADTFALSETGPAGYTASGWVCVGGTQNSASITLGINQEATCTITNDDVAPQLTVIKQVVNDNTGTKVAGDFTMNVTGTNVSLSSFPGSASGTTVTLNAGSYSVGETAVSGYSTTYSAGCSGTLALGATATCTVTNDDVPPPPPSMAQLIVVKHVVNNSGGTKAASDFTMSVTGTNVSSSSFAGSESGTTVTLDPGSYSVDESAVAGYAKSLSADCSGTIAAGETKTCTITNDDVAPQLTVTKVVVNDDGGTKQVSDFALFVGTTPVTSGVGSTFSAGSYTVSESGDAGYTAAFSGDCSGSGSITLSLGDVKTCTITNNDTAAPLPTTGTLVVKKHVVNDDEGTKVASDFTMSVTGTNVSSSSFAGTEGGTTVTLDPGSYSVSEGATTGYSSSLSADCSGTIAAGETKTCTVTNDDVAPDTLSIFNEASAAATDTTLTITWETSHSATSRVVYDTVSHPTPGAAPNYGYSTSTIEDATLGTSHSVVVAGLTPGTTYFLRSVSHGSPEVVGNEIVKATTGGGSAGGSSGGGGGGVTVVNPNAATVAVSIAQGPTSTSSVVTLSFTYGTDITGLLLSNYTDFHQQSFLLPAAQSAWTLLPGNGERTVYARFLTSSGGFAEKSARATVTAAAPQVLGVQATAPGVPQARVLGASTSCPATGSGNGLYLSSYLRYGKKNNAAEVRKLQQFLNEALGTKLPVNGVYGPKTLAAVNQFQLAHSQEVLKPWVPYGLPNEKTPTGYVYKTTKRWINMLKCPDTALPVPQLP